jgi:hypothetical protein
MSGAIPPFPQYAFMAWWSVKNTGTTLPLPAILYDCETRSLTVGEERGLRLFENSLLRRVFRPTRDELVLLRVIKLSRMIRAERVNTHVGDEKHVQKTTWET